MIACLRACVVKVTRAIVAAPPLLILAATAFPHADRADAATPVRITVDGASSTTPSIARGSDGNCRVVWSDSRAGGTEIFFTMVDGWGNRLLPDIQVSHSTGVSSTVPRIDVDAQGYAYVCWLENKTVWIAKVDVGGNVVDSTAVSLGFNYLAEFPDIDVTPSNGLGVGFTSQSGVSDEDYMVLFDSDLNKLCQRLMFTNLTWFDRHVTIACSDDRYCTMYWQSSHYFNGENLSGGAMTPTCGNFGSGNICSGNNYSTMSNHAAGLVVQRGNRIHVGNGAGCPAAFSELPGPSITPSATFLDATRSLVAWDDRRSANADIYFAVYSNSTLTKTGVDSLLAGGSASSSLPSATSDRVGTAMVVWQDNRDGNNEVYFARTPEPASFGTFVGTIYDAVTLQPIPYAEVRIQGPERNPLMPARTFVAGGNGQYRAAGLPPGLHSLVASSVGHVSPSLDGTLLVAGQTRVVDLYVSTGVVVAGTVRDVDCQRGIRGAQVTLEAQSGPPFVRSAITGLDGRYRFDVSPGDFTLTVRDTVPGDSTDYFSTANDYYTPATIPVTGVTADRTVNVDLSSNTVVLLHGIRSNGEMWGKAAFVGASDSLLRAHLEHAGYHTEAPSRDWRRSIPEQGSSVARWFADQEFVSARVIAHSMGGLAGRWFIEELPSIGRPAPLLVTLGTPHHGSPVAGDLHGFLLTIGALPEALGLVPFTGGLTLFAWESLIREAMPFLIDLEPGSANLNQMNYGTRDRIDHPSRFLCSLSGGPSHDPELLSPSTVYVAMAGESPTLAHQLLQPILGAACANDGVVPVHSARLWNPSAANLRTRCLANAGTGGDCDVAHSQPHLAVSQPDAASVLTNGEKFVTSRCVAVHLVNILQGHIPSEDCAVPPSHTASVADSLYDALPEFDVALGAQDSLTTSFTVSTGQSLVVWIRWQRGGTRARLVSPSGAVVDSAACEGNPTRLYLGDPSFRWSRFGLTAPAVGTWTVHVSSDADSAQHVSVRALMSGDVTLDAAVRAPSPAPGGPVRIEGTLLRSGVALSEATVGAIWSGPGGAAGSTAMHDDGNGADASAGDGVYSGEIVPSTSGLYGILVQASGGSGPSYGARASTCSFRAALAPDIRMVVADLVVPQSWTYPGDSVFIQAHVHNDGSAAADSAWFVARNDSTGAVISSVLVAVPGGGEKVLSFPFVSTHRGLNHLSLAAVAVGDQPDSDPANSSVGIGLEVVDFGDAPVIAVPPVPASIPTGSWLLSRVIPTPAHDHVRLEFFLPEPAIATRLVVYDLAGRLIHRAEQGASSAGWQRFDWSIARGQTRVPAGVFFYRIEGGSRTARGTIIVR